MRVFHLKDDLLSLDFKAEAASCVTNISFGQRCDHIIVCSGVAGQPGLIEIVSLEKSYDYPAGNLLSGWFKPYSVIGKLQLVVDHPQIYSIMAEDEFYIISSKGKIHRIGVEQKEKRVSIRETEQLNIDQPK